VAEKHKGRGVGQHDSSCCSSSCYFQSVFFGARERLDATAETRESRRWQMLAFEKMNETTKNK